MPLSLVALAIGLYLPSLDNQFLYDDHEIILSNPPLSSFGDLLQIFRERHFPRVPYYRPITRTTFLLQKTLHGDRPEPFHLVNFLLLAATGLLAYALLQLPQFQVQPVPALLASALFVVHPVASSCVYPICSGRETLLPTALTLAALYALLRAGSAWYATAVALFVLSLFAKEQMVVVPALFVVADLLRLSGDPPGRDLGRWLRRYAPFPLILVGYLVIRHDLFGGTEYRFSDGSEVPFAFLYALQTIVAPFYQLIYEPSREVWLSAVRLLLSVAVMLGLGWAVSRKWQSLRSPALFWILWFILLLAPTANILEQEAQFDERYVLGALFAPLALAASLLSLHWKNRRLRQVVSILTVLLIGLGSLATLHRDTYFQDYSVFADQWLKTNPRSLNAHNSLGAIHLHRGNPAEAEKHFRETLALAPDLAETHSNLGASLLAQNRVNQALDHLRQALRIDPTNARTHNNLGTVYLRLGSLESAVTHFTEALRFTPKFAEAEANLANALLQRRKVHDGIEHYRRALALRPDWLTIQNRLAWILATYDRAGVRDAAQAIRLAEQNCQATRYQDPLFLDTLSAAYAEAGRFPDALRSARRGLEIALSQGLQDLAQDLQSRLRAYQIGLPIRQLP